MHLRGREGDKYDVLSKGELITIFIIHKEKMFEGSNCVKQFRRDFTFNKIALPFFPTNDSARYISHQWDVVTLTIHAGPRRVRTNNPFHTIQARPGHLPNTIL